MSTTDLETRWIVLGTDGRHVSLGRHSDPSTAEIEKAEAALAAHGLAGWLALLQGDYYVRHRPSVMMVRTLGEPSLPFAEAIEKFESLRREALHLSA
jgi:hypothetical protein